MSTNVNNYIKITMPRLMMNKDAAPLDALQAAFDAATKEAGGVSITPSSGVWFDEDGKRYVDENEVWQWNFGHRKRDKMRELTRAIVDAAFECGEKAVFRERNYTAHDEAHIMNYTVGYRADIIHAPTKH